MNKDRETAKKYLQQALDGDLMAMNNMGVCYAQGIGVVENHATAFEWYMKAATLGDTYACYNVAECYYQGDAQAQFSTGWFYMIGTGVKQDKRMGLKWIHKATAQGFEYAKQWCKDNGYSIY